MEPLFYEEQPFRLPYFLTALGIASVACLAAVIWQVMTPDVSSRTPTASRLATVSGTAFLWLLFARLATVSLVTEVNAGELSVSLHGLWKSCRIPLAKVKSAHPVTFDPEREYGGYGVRATRCARAFTVTGDRGVRIELVDGAALVIGSRHPQQLAKAICDQLTVRA